MVRERRGQDRSDPGPQTVTYEHLSVTALSPTTATVSVDTCFGTTKFKDMFALVRAGDKW